MQLQKAGLGADVTAAPLPAPFRFHPMVTRTSTRRGGRMTACGTIQGKDQPGQEWVGKPLLLDIVDLYQADTRRVITAPDNGGIKAGGSCGVNRTFARITGRETKRFDGIGLSGILLPVVIGSNQCPVIIIQFQSRISETFSDTLTGERRSDRPHDQGRRWRSLGASRPSPVS